MLSRTPSNERDTLPPRPMIGTSRNSVPSGDGSTARSRGCWVASHLRPRPSPSRFVRRSRSLRTRHTGQGRRCERRRLPASAPPGADMSSRSAPMPPGATVTDKGDLPDILLEVCTRTDLADRFTHVNERGARVADFQISLSRRACRAKLQHRLRADDPVRHPGPAPGSPLMGESEIHPQRDPAGPPTPSLWPATTLCRSSGSGAPETSPPADGVRSPPRTARLSRSTRRAHRRLPERARRKTRRSRPHAQRDCLLERHLHASRRIFLRFRETRRGIPRIHCLRTHHRCVAIVLTRLRQLSVKTAIGH